MTILLYLRLTRIELQYIGKYFRKKFGFWFIAKTCINLLYFNKVSALINVKKLKKFWLRIAT